MEPKLDSVRRDVRRVLAASPAWRDLRGDERRNFAQNLVKLAHYLKDDPGWLEARPEPSAAEALQSPPRLVGADFKAGAMKQGVQRFDELVKTVDFPAFVSGLVQNVFQAIVDASLQQMEAFGELLAATAKSVDQFARDHISDDQAREQVASRYPSLVVIERGESGSRLVAREEAGDLSALRQLAPGSGDVDLDDEDKERQLMLAAKLEMARQRQKMMALMVLLGLNRIIVTNGKINAKVIFDVDTSDRARRIAKDSSESMTDFKHQSAMGGWGIFAAAGMSNALHHRTTVRSAVEDDSESRARMKAQLSGEVQVNFRSQALPPERLLDAIQQEHLNTLAQPGQPQPGAPPPPSPPAPPAQEVRR